MNADRSFMLCHVVNVVLVEISKPEQLEGQSEWGIFLWPPKQRDGLIYSYMCIWLYLKWVAVSDLRVVSRHCLCTVMWPTEDPHFVQGACAIYAMQLLFRNVAMSKYTRVISFLVDALPRFWCRLGFLPKHLWIKFWGILNTPAMLSRFFFPPTSYFVIAEVLQNFRLNFIC
jgi:hypothetical protein